MSQEFEPEPIFWNEARLVGYLVRGAKGRPVEYVNLPTDIALEGVLYQKVDLVWSVSEADRSGREYSLAGYTKFDNNVHFQGNPIPGDEKRVFRSVRLIPWGRLPVLGIHSHVIKNTPPSLTDIGCVAAGLEQAEIVTTETAVFMVVRTDKTPKIGLIDDLVARLGRIEREKFGSLLEQQEEEIRNLVGDGDFDLDALTELMEQQRYKRNRFICDLLIQVCDFLFLGLYYGQKDGCLVRVTSVEQLEPYIQGLEGDISDDIEDLVRKRRRELDPELRKIDPSIIDEELKAEAVGVFNDFLGDPGVQAHFAGSWLDVKKQYESETGGSMTEEEFLALILERGDFDPEDDVGSSFAALSGLVKLMDEMGLLGKKD